MCGIIGYTGKEDAKEIMLDALELLEYRGYDSAGIALLNENGTQIVKRAGRVKDLRNLCKEKNILPVCEASRNLSVVKREGAAGVVYAVVETDYEKGLFCCPCRANDRLSGKTYEEGEQIEVKPYGVMLLEKI